MNRIDWRLAYAAAGNRALRHGGGRYWLALAVTGISAFLISLAVRSLEIPAWDNPAYRLGEEHLLATHDAYHWIAGAEGFEFGAGHPLSELIRILSGLFGALPANVGFWMPLFLGSLLAVGVFAWGAALGAPCAGMVAGILAACSPGYLARTMLGYCDTDLVILIFAVLLGFAPMLWLRPWLASPLQWLAGCWRFAARAAVFLRKENSGSAVSIWERIKTLRAFGVADWKRHGELLPSAMRIVQIRSLGFSWLLFLILAGLFGYSTQTWHSFFPYAVRFCAGVTPLLIVALGPYGGRRFLLAGALCFCLPLLGGWLGCLAAVAMGAVLLRHRAVTRPGGAASFALPASLLRVLDLAARYLFTTPWALLALWGAVAVLLLDASVWQGLARSFASYLKTSGDLSHDLGKSADPLVFPSVAQSIIEVQNLSFLDFLDYFHPISVISLMGLAGYGLLLLLRPGTVYLVIMLAIALSSLKLGGRMAMFGSPVLALGLCLAVDILLRDFCALSRNVKGLALIVERFFHFEAAFSWRRFLCSASLSVLLVVPIVRLLPEMSKGPIISREQAEALTFLRDKTPGDSLVWNWWDWGYATHHFARRRTISDGARHGGPSLFVPAAVYTTDDPHFARQLMAYTSEKGGDPGDVFEGLSAAGAAALLADLGAGKLAPQPKSKQYIVVSFELVPLGFWVSTYGNWDFVKKEGKGYYISAIPQSLQYNIETGVVLMRGLPPVYAASIDIFGPQKLERQSYFRAGSDLHFIFNTVTGEKYSVKEDFYSMMLYQLLVAAPKDTRIKPYFKLIFDNTMVRVYEML